MPNPKMNAAKMKAEALKKEFETEVTYGSYDVNEAMTYTGIHILDQADIELELVEFIEVYSCHPRIKCQGRKITHFTYKNADGNDVTICADANCGEEIDWKQLNLSGNY